LSGLAIRLKGGNRRSAGISSTSASFYQIVLMVTPLSAVLLGHMVFEKIRAGRPIVAALASVAGLDGKVWMRWVAITAEVEFVCVREA
jgi:hypothetical protein